MLSFMEQHVFVFSFIIEGATKKGFTIYNATEVNVQQKPWLHWTENVVLNTTKRLKL